MTGHIDRSNKNSFFKDNKLLFRFIVDKIYLINMKIAPPKDFTEFAANVKGVLDAVSSCFCIAKWSRTTINLHNGTTHSCHIPPPHEISLQEIATNPAALNNTGQKIEERKKMVGGERPASCNACWQVEDLHAGSISNRIVKSGHESATHMIPAILNDPFSTKLNPTYVEVSFSNKCQFKCSYCSAKYSSAWEEEILKFGNYPGVQTLTDKNLQEKTNPYIAAFWEWWPELKKTLHTFRITGGEPLLAASTFKILENLLVQPEPNLTLAVNSNLGVPLVLFEKFNSIVHQINKEKAVKKVELFASIDCDGLQAEYIRYGLDHKVFWTNADSFLELNFESRITIMCTFNALSLFSFIPLLQKIMSLNVKHQNSSRVIPIFIDLSYLHAPEYQCVQVLPASYLENMEAIVNFISDHQIKDQPYKGGFTEGQKVQAKRILELMRRGVSPETKLSMQKKFYEFFSEHDRRRNTDFVKTFPELNSFWEKCQS